MYLQNVTTTFSEFHIFKILLASWIGWSTYVLITCRCSVYVSPKYIFMVKNCKWIYHGTVHWNNNFINQYDYLILEPYSWSYRRQARLANRLVGNWNTENFLYFMEFMMLLCILLPMYFSLCSHAHNCKACFGDVWMPCLYTVKYCHTYNDEINCLLSYLLCRHILWHYKIANKKIIS